ncbi:MAG: endonuclease/exonuclease/phosphatase family protein [Gammaproteobacteria bacterium]
MTTMNAQPAFEESGASLSLVSRPATGRRVRLLSYNIQAGIPSSTFYHYVTHSWKHVLPHAELFDNLDRIAQLISGYDIVGLQEVDGGSLRSGFINQALYLANKAQFPHCYDQTNRKLGKIAQHSNGLLSKFRPTELIEHKLPGLIPGRGALLVRFGSADHPLVLVIAHLALSRRARLRQLAYLSELVNEYEHVIVMGDLNCPSGSKEIHSLLDRTQLLAPAHGLHTFPSWRPVRNIDHILVTPSLKVEDMHVLHCPCSDHLPIAMEIIIPDTVRLEG